MPILLLLLLPLPLPLPLQPEREPSPPAQSDRATQGIQTGVQGTDAEEGWEEIARFSRLYGMDPLLIRAVVEVESGHDPLARSPRGAMGLMQLMPETLREMNVADPWDREENLKAGIRYLRHLLDRFDGSLVLALAAYNAGPRWVRRHRGVPPFRETRTYVRRVLARYRRFQREAAEASGASPWGGGG